MLVLVTYDVSTAGKEGQRRLTRIAKECLNYGQRVQNSVFECEFDYATYLILKNKLLNIMDKEKDSIRIYRLGKSGAQRVEHFGVKTGYDPKGVLIV